MAERRDGVLQLQVPDLGEVFDPRSVKCPAAAATHASPHQMGYGPPQPLPSSQCHILIPRFCSMVDHQTSPDAAMQQQQSRLLANEDISLGPCYNVLGVCGGGKSIDQNLKREMKNKRKREEAKENSPSQMQNNSPTAETMPSEDSTFEVGNAPPPPHKKKRWSADEDRKLAQLAEKEKSLTKITCSEISHQMEKKGQWTVEEYENIIRMQREFGNQ
jgi:hypothetical protein